MTEQLKRDQNHVTVQGAVTDDVNQTVEMWRADATTKRLLVSAVVAGSENGKILVDGSDTTYEYLATKLVAGTGITLTVLNPGGNETLEIASVGSTYYNVVQEDGVSVTQRPRLNFVNYFAVSDNAGNTSSDVNLNIGAIEPALDLANLGGQLNLATQVTGQLDATNIDQSSLDLSMIGGQIDLSTQVTGVLPAANIDITDLEGDLDLANIGGQIDLTTQATGTLPVANGGTGASTLTGVLHGNGTSAVTAIPLTTDGAILIGDGATAPTTLNAFTSSTGNLKLANGGTGASLTDPNADRIMFWDDSAGEVTWLTAGSGLSITGTTISSSATASSILKVGVGAITDQTIFNAQLPFDAELWSVPTNNYTNVYFSPGNGAYTLVGVFPGVSGGSNAAVFSDARIFIVESISYINASGQIGAFGFNVANNASTPTASTNLEGAYFVSDGTDTFAQVATGAARTQVNLGALSTGLKKLRVELDRVLVTPECRFYINGTLVATITTNLPNTSVIGVTYANDTGDAFTESTGAPSIAMAFAAIP